MAEAGRTLTARVAAEPGRKLFGKSKFDVDVENSQVTCPAGHTAERVTQEQNGTNDIAGRDIKKPFRGRLDWQVLKLISITNADVPPVGVCMPYSPILVGVFRRPHLCGNSDRPSTH